MVTLTDLKLAKMLIPICLIARFWANTNLMFLKIGTGCNPTTTCTNAALSTSLTTNLFQLDADNLIYYLCDL